MFVMYSFSFAFGTKRFLYYEAECEIIIYVFAELQVESSSNTSCNLQGIKEIIVRRLEIRKILFTRQKMNKVLPANH